MAGRRRLVQLLGAGLVDSLCLSVAWTIVVLQVAAQHGLGAVGALTAAALIGVAASAPVASWGARRLDGRDLLGAAVATEALLRLSVFGLVLAGAPVWVVGLCACLLNLVAWIGFASMRAEVLAATASPVALACYGTAIAAVEAIGIAIAAVLPVLAGDWWDGALVVVVVVYVVALLPTALVARTSTIPRAAQRSAAPGAALRSLLSGPSLSGAFFMFAGAAPTMLAVALAERLHGRSAVALAAGAFTLGALAAPMVVRLLQRWAVDRTTILTVCALGMLSGWIAAPWHVALLGVAQVLSGAFMTTLESLLDNAAAVRQPDQVTGALAQATAGRALGSAAGTAAFPLLMVHLGLQVGVATLIVLVVSAAALTGALRSRAPRPGAAVTGRRPEEAAPGRGRPEAIVAPPMAR